VCPETETGLPDQGIEVRIAKTEKAIEEYNRLRRGRPVGALIHSTC